ncbi:hypothetical protein RhiJN_03806 [Ceratobasidium sp. AG-Ba]|nr:hypothetical protein RhiJN_03806 [Ceratobasidium sp. AG-Ba]QRW04700.1 hypothetical protein RhiLY_03699 [Ceratobasidium sp. AG-Ba]
MPPKRANPSGSTGERPAKKAATSANKTSTPRLKKSKSPNWSEASNSEYSQEKPTGEWGAKCVERWCLLPPYNLSITEAQWKTYYSERSALDKVNTPGTAESKEIVSEELCQDTWAILRKMSGNVAAAIFGASLDEEHKKQIGRTMLGSLYFTEMWGNDYDDHPCEIRSMSRLYSPFGLGTSIDLYYTYNLRHRIMMRGERYASFYVASRTIHNCDAKNPRSCSAVEKNSSGVQKAAYDAITVFDRNMSKSKSTTAANIKTFEEPLFACEGWLSPLKLTQMLFAAGGVMHFKEEDKETPKAALGKFQYFQGESDGQAILKAELARLGELEKAADQGRAVPQRLLLLARQNDSSSGEQEA